MNPLEHIEAKRSLAGVAELLWGYFSDLKEQGFTDEQALRIALSWQASIMQLPPMGDDE